MELSTSVPGGSSRRGSVFGALARRAWNITPVVPGEISRPTDITGTHTRTTMLVERQNKTDREKKIELQENVEAAEDRVRDLRRRRAIESVEAANDALQARPDLKPQVTGSVTYFLQLLQRRAALEELRQGEVDGLEFDGADTIGFHESPCV